MQEDPSSPKNNPWIWIVVIVIAGIGVMVPGYLRHAHWVFLILAWVGVAVLFSYLLGKWMK